MKTIQIEFNVDWQTDPDSFYWEAIIDEKNDEWNKNEIQESLRDAAETMEMECVDISSDWESIHGIRSSTLAGCFTASIPMIVDVPKMFGFSYQRGGVEMIASLSAVELSEGGMKCKYDVEASI